ncbi:hypothetical protein BDW67DRAFT_43161 [Aspergillus spinulosporus]
MPNFIPPSVQGHSAFVHGSSLFIIGSSGQLSLYPNIELLRRGVGKPNPTLLLTAQCRPSPSSMIFNYCPATKIHIAALAAHRSRKADLYRSTELQPTRICMIIEPLNVSSENWAVVLRDKLGQPIRSLTWLKSAPLLGQDLWGLCARPRSAVLASRSLQGRRASILLRTWEAVGTNVPRLIGADTRRGMIDRLQGQTVSGNALELDSTSAAQTAEALGNGMPPRTLSKDFMVAGPDSCQKESLLH